ncbi:putative flavonol synthase/flavanone 3-hydroxylase-like isoform 2 [Capsicum annuum]|nr:putative flavonol synthase/flavanone 3-hydroxylase-like isoform 2 [Capsicum annuum]
MASTKVKVPTIDISNIKPNTPKWESTKIQAFEALQEYGCFEAKYDNVPNEIREAMFATSKEIFEFPLETKLKNLSKKPFHGYVGMIPDLLLYETLCIDDLLNPQSVENFAIIFWPHSNPDFCNLVRSCSNPLVE